MTGRSRQSRKHTLITLLSGGTIGRGITAISLLWLARLYAPESFGTLAVFAAIGSFLIPLSTLRYELAIPIARGSNAVRDLIVLSSGNTLIVASGTAFLAGVYTGFTGEYLSIPLPPAIAWLLPGLVVGGGLYSVTSYWALRLEQYGPLARTQVTRSAGQVAAQSILGIVSGGPFGLVLGYVVGQIVGVWTLALNALRLDPIRPKSVRLESLRATAWTYRRFPLLSAPSSVLNEAGLHIPALFLAAMYGPLEAGLFFMATRAIRTPSSLVAKAVSQAYVGEFSEALRQGHRTLQPIYLTYVSRMAALGILPTIALLLFGPELFERVLGESWAPSGHYARILAIAFLGQFVVSPVSPTAFLLQKQGLQLIGDAARLVLVVIAFSAAVALEWSAPAAIQGYGAALVLSYTGFLIMYGVIAGNADREQP